MSTDFEEVTLFGKPALFSAFRIDRTTVPRGYHLYEVRHDDGCQGIAVQLGHRIIVNHWGTIITRDKVRLRAEGFLGIKDEDIHYGCGDIRSMAGYMAAYPPKARPPKEQER
jgi:hypothetical protein